METKNGIPILTSPLINENVAMTTTATYLNEIGAMGYLMTLMKRGTLHFVPPVGWGYPETAVGANTVNSAIGTKLELNTGADEGVRSIIVRNEIAACTPGQLVGFLDWSKEQYFLTSLLRVGDTANGIARLQIKEGYTLGAVGARGIEILMANYAVYGAAFGTGGTPARGQTAKLCDMTDSYWMDVFIHHQPAIPQIDFYVDTGSGWSTVVSLTDTANVPQTVSAAECDYCLSVEKDAVVAVVRIYTTGLYHFTVSR